MEVWDGKPQEVEYRGQNIEVFYRSALAMALNRKIGTICAMERNGVLCHPRLRSGRGRWLYTRDQIEELAALAVAENLSDPRYRRPFTNHFIEQAWAILSRLPDI
jgi:hypothetical protein